MSQTWQWDRTLFEGSAPYYQRGRHPYPPQLVAVLTEALRLDGQGRLLDVGCGPGTLALDLAPVFREVVGVDPDRGMIAEAERRSVEMGVTGKCRWVHARAEELSADLGTFTIATFGQSFHWMDRDAVAATVKAMLTPEGALVHIAPVHSETRSTADLPYPAVPYEAIDDLVKRRLGPVRRAGQGVLPHGTPDGEAEVLARAGFTGQRYVVPGGQVLERSTEDVAAHVFSLSWSAPHLFGDDRDAFEADLQRMLHEVSASGRFSDRTPSTEVFVWRKSPISVR